MKFNFIEKFKKYKRKKMIKRIIYPCSDKNCLVRSSCTKGCDKLLYKKEELTEFFTKYSACPDCGSEKFFGGPCGGLSQNVKCAGCGHYFNFALPLFVERIHLGPNNEFIKSWQ